MASLEHCMTALKEEMIHVNLQNLQIEKEIQTERPTVSLELEAPSEDSPGPDIDVNILRQKCKQMKAQIDNFDKTKINLLPDNLDIRYLMLKESYGRSLEQLEDCYGFLQYDMNELSKEIKREEKTNQELYSFISAAEERQNETEQETQPKKNAYKQLEIKHAALAKRNTDRAIEMTSFLGKYFPLPNHEDFMKVKKKMETEAKSEKDLLPLNDMVQELMNLCVERPNDPYLVLTHRHWPPYVVLLLQCDVALRHPSDSHRIKLMPFKSLIYTQITCDSQTHTESN